MNKNMDKGENEKRQASGRKFFLVMLILFTTTAAVFAYDASKYSLRIGPNTTYFEGHTLNPLRFNCKDPVYGQGIKETGETKYQAFVRGGAGLFPNKALYPDKTGNGWFVWDLQGRPGTSRFGYVATNCKKWDEEKRKYQYLDVEYTVKEWQVTKGYKRRHGPYMALKKDPYIDLRTNGLIEVKIDINYFWPGTKNPIEIKTNGTIKDIDDYQMAGMTPLVGYTGSVNSGLRKHPWENKFASPTKGNESEEDPRFAVGYAIAGSKFEFTFGENGVGTGSANDAQTWYNLWSKGCSAVHTYTYSFAKPKNNIPKIKPWYENLEERERVESSGWDVNLPRETFYEDENITVGAFIKDEKAEGQKVGDIVESNYALLRNGKVFFDSAMKSVNTEVAGATNEHIISQTIKELGKGEYKVMWYARDNVPEYPGAGPVEFEFQVLDKEARPIKIEGTIEHTNKWEENRNFFNKFYHEKSGRRYETKAEQISIKDYAVDPRRPRERGSNVFWPGEKLVIEATSKQNVEGIKVILENSRGVPCGFNNYLYETWLTKEGDKWVGSIWHQSMIERGGKEPEEVIGVFIPYQNGAPKEEFRYSIIIDNYRPYWDLDFKIK